MRATIDTNGLIVRADGETYALGAELGRRPAWVNEFISKSLSADQKAVVAKVTKVRRTGTMTCPETGKVHTFGHRGRPPLWVQALLAKGVRPEAATEATVEVDAAPAAEA